MRKILSTILTMIMVLSISSNVFAAGNADSLTPDQKAAKDTFMSTFYTQWQTLVDLRLQTVKALEVNKALRTQIATAAKNSSTLDKDSLAKIKTVALQNKDIVTQIKALDVQRKDLVTKWHAAVKAKDTSTMASLSDQIKGLNSQITTLKAQIKTNSDTIKPLKDQIKVYRDAVSKRKTTLTPLRQAEKTLHDKIVSEEKAKSALWTTYRAAIKNKDYAVAKTTFQSIIDAKKQILVDIKENTSNLNNILAALKQV
ncbi:MAG: hypothetical protein H7Y18_06650 [Clostridiaceae bacterium]|nr:hypothetical protein [Clostridiaceae bacterium]